MSDVLITGAIVPLATIDVGVRDYAVGSHQINSVPIDVGLSRASVMLGRSSWTNGTSQVSARFEISLDGGVTWSPNPQGESSWPWGEFPVTFTANGGTLLDKRGQVVALSGFSTNLPQPDNTNRRVRGTFTVSGATARFPITVEAI